MTKTVFNSINNYVQNTMHTIHDPYAEHSLSLSSVSIPHDHCCADVDSKVYYFSGKIKSIRLGLDNWSFFTDKLRSKTILKWMKFYAWYPQMTTEIDKQHRNELKRHLKLREGQFSKQRCLY
jgi:hypothetical protein